MFTVLLRRVQDVRYTRYVNETANTTAAKLGLLFCNVFFPPCMLHVQVLQQVARSPVADTLIQLSVPPTPLLLAGVDRHRRVFPRRADGWTDVRCVWGSLQPVGGVGLTAAATAGVGGCAHNTILQRRTHAHTRTAVIYEFVCVCVFVRERMCIRLWWRRRP